MNQFTVSNIGKKRTIILMQEWLRGWDMPPAQPLHCPKCRSEMVRRMLRSVARKVLRCRACGYEFSLEELPGCRCTYPGQLLKCVDCKHFQNMMDYVTRHQGKFLHLSERELDSIISAPGFWERNMKPQVSELESRESEPTQQEQITDANASSTSDAPNALDDSSTPDSSSVYQLSLFDEIFSEIQDLQKLSENRKQESDSES